MRPGWRDVESKVKTMKIRIASLGTALLIALLAPQTVAAVPVGDAACWPVSFQHAYCTWTAVPDAAGYAAFVNGTRVPFEASPSVPFIDVGRMEGLIGSLIGPADVVEIASFDEHGRSGQTVRPGYRSYGYVFIPSMTLQFGMREFCPPSTRLPRSDTRFERSRATEVRSRSDTFSTGGTMADQPMTVHLDQAATRRLIIGGLALWVATKALLWAFGVTSHFLFVLLLSWLLAIAMEPPVAALARRGWKRGGAAGLVLILMIAVVAAFLSVFGGLFFSQLAAAVQALPNVVDSLVKWINSTFDAQLDPTTITQELRLTPEKIASVAGSVAGGVLGVVSSVVAFLFEILTVLVFAFYLSAESPATKRTVATWLSPKRQHVFITVWDIAVAKTCRSRNALSSTSVRSTANAGITTVPLRASVRVIASASSVRPLATSSCTRSPYVDSMTTASAFEGACGGTSNGCDGRPRSPLNTTVRGRSPSSDRRSTADPRMCPLGSSSATALGQSVKS